MNRNFATGYKCIKCQKEYEITQTLYTCPSCGANLQIVYDYEKIKKELTREKIENRKDYSMGRYIEFYPIRFEPEKYLKLKIGWTPLYKSELLGQEIGYTNFYLKDDTHNPSASFKDRASIIALIDALERGEKLIVGASTGNAASSLACLSASIGMKTLILIPKTAPVAKVAQLLIYGANLIMVDGSYDDAFDLSLKITEKYGFYNRNTGFNPFTREGKKSVSFEIIEQLGWKVPDYVFVPVGDGNIISGVWKGFNDMYNAGLIDKLPRIICVQSEKSSAVANAYFENSDEIKPVKATTIADSISVDLPRDGLAALYAIKESNGFAIIVRDEEILEAQKLLASKRGIFAEPAGATALAGLIKAIKENKINNNELSVVLVTGNGLKDINAVIKNVRMPEPVQPDINSISNLIPST